MKSKGERKMKKKLIALLLSLMLVVTFAAGCGSTSGSDSASPSTDASAPSDSPAAETGSDSPAAETSSDGELDHLTLQLKWIDHSQFMGYLVAAEKGYYEDEGIDIEILAGGSDIIPEQNVYNGVADIGVTWVSSLMTYQAQGYDLVEVAQMFQKSGLLLVSQAASGINSPEDLEGKNIGSWFGGNEYEVYALLEKYGLMDSVTLVQQDYTMDQVAEGSIDAASAMTYNELKLFYDEGFNKDEANVIDMNDEGVAMLEDCLFVTSEWAEANEDLLVRFLRASIKGWQEAIADTDAAGTLCWNYCGSISEAHQQYMAAEVAKLACPDGFDPSMIGYIDMDAVQQTADYLAKYNKDLAATPVVDETTFDSTYWNLATGN
jgi:NitT/TauT family transport system substrate-binding protein